jgi:transposase InsO family protein
MSKREVFEFETLQKYLSGFLFRSDTAILLGYSTKTISRKAKKVSEQGMLGIIHGNRNRRPVNKKSDLLEHHVKKMITERYYDRNIKHIQETLSLEHSITIKYSTLRRWCHDINIVKKKKKRRPSQTRRKRNRMAHEGFLLQMDGSPHYYVPGKEWTLIAAIDDATNDIAASQFYASETTFNCMDILEQVIKNKGVPWGIYVDRAGCLGGSKRANFGEFRRACEDLGIELIFANSPQAKGRIERWFQVPQDRLVAELRTQNITDMDKANEYLKKNFIAEYWQENKTIAPASPESKYRGAPSDQELREIFSQRYLRKINNDYTFKWKTNIYQIKNPNGDIRNQDVELRFYKDGESAVFHGARKLDVELVVGSVKREVA